MELPLAVYVHVPWCLQRCPYCDFATEAIQPSRIPHAAYGEAVSREVALRVEALARDGYTARAKTLFFGGGTPSLLSHDALGAIVRAVSAHGDLDEVTVECNPTSIDRERAESLRDRGVTRLSLGVQSLRDAHLRYLGRLHDADGAVRALRGAVSAGGLRVSADVMFGMADQDCDALADDLRALVGEGVEHLSCYALTIEPATRFGELARKGRLPRLTDDAVAAMYERVERTLGDEGLGHYEVSNYARAGKASTHNQMYWRGEAYLGLGAGAVGCVPDRAGDTARRWRNDADPARYLDALGRVELPPGDTEALDAETRVREAFLLGLRTEDGVSMTDVAARTGADPWAGRAKVIEAQTARGNLERMGDVLRIPRSRWLLADDITSRVM